MTALSKTHGFKGRFWPACKLKKQASKNNDCV
jgi:hypothetical protein